MRKDPHSCCATLRDTQANASAATNRHGTLIVMGVKLPAVGASAPHKQKLRKHGQRTQLQWSLTSNAHVTAGCGSRHAETHLKQLKISTHAFLTTTAHPPLPYCPPTMTCAFIFILKPVSPLEGTLCLCVPKNCHSDSLAAPFFSLWHAVRRHRLGCSIMINENMTGFDKSSPRVARVRCKVVQRSS